MLSHLFRSAPPALIAAGLAGLTTMGMVGLNSLGVLQRSELIFYDIATQLAATGPTTDPLILLNVPDTARVADSTTCGARNEPPG